jgi:restriction system protein
MALWLVRAGRSGEHEYRFFQDSRVYLTWTGPLQDVDLGKAQDYEGIKRLVVDAYPTESKNRVQNWAGQIWAFVLPMKPGDWLAVPQKTKAAIAFGEITGPYSYNPKAEPPYRHSRTVKWLNTDVPRTALDQDLLYSLGAFMTVCEIKRNDAEKRIRAMAQSAWRTSTIPVLERTGSEASAGQVTPEAEESVDLERLGRDQIARLINRRFKGHEMARLVQEILKAMGYTTFRSSPGPDKGIDILASAGPLGFDRPRICVQVKSQDAPVDSPTLNQLIGTMQNVQADQGLLVAWGGFKSSVDKEAPTQFFRVRLWDQDDLIDQLLGQYDKLSEELRAELPLKRVWTVAAQESEE